MGWIPAKGTKLLQAVCHEQKEKRKETTNSVKKTKRGLFSILRIQRVFHRVSHGGARRAGYAEVTAASLPLSIAPRHLYLGGPSISVAMEICSVVRTCMDLPFRPSLNKNTYADLILSSHTSLYQ